MVGRDSGQVVVILLVRGGGLLSKLRICSELIIL
jgi:hypothetical protein